MAEVKSVDKWLFVAAIIALIIFGMLIEFTTRIGLPNIAYGQPDTVRVVSVPDTIHDTITALKTIVRHDTVTNTVVSYPITDFDAVDTAKTVYTAGKRYADGDSIGVGVSSSILPDIVPADWIWTLERYRSGDTSYNVARLDTVKLFRPVSWGIGPYVGFGYGNGWGASAGIAITKILIRF